MQVQEYIFRSPYPSRVQIGQPETTNQNSNSTKNSMQIENQETNSKITNANVKSTLGNVKLTADTNKLDLYA